LDVLTLGMLELGRAETSSARRFRGNVQAITGMHRRGRWGWCAGDAGSVEGDLRAGGARCRPVGPRRRRRWRDCGM